MKLLLKTVQRKRRHFERSQRTWQGTNIHPASLLILSSTGNNALLHLSAMSFTACVSVVIKKLLLSWTNWSPLCCSLTPKGLSPALTPALQRLVNLTSSKNTDKALRASYTPSPSHRAPVSPFGGSTPSGTPTPDKAKTPGSQDVASLTDNLLQLPKRRKASDFF